MTAHPMSAELERELANLQRQLQELAEQDAAERRQLAATLEGLAQQLDDLDTLHQQRSQALEQARAARERIQELEQQVRDLQAQLEQRHRQAQEPRPAAKAAVAPATRGRQLVLGTAGLGLLLGLGLGVHHQLRQRNPAAAPQAAATTMLELQADQPSWLEVRSNSGQNLFVGELQGSKRFAIGAGLQVLAGRPDLVTVRLGTAPPRPLGRIEDVDWHRFSPGGSATQEPQQSNQSRNQEESGQQQN